MNPPELMLAEREPIAIELFDLLREQAAVLLKTGFLPAHIKTPEQAVAVVLIGRELGVPMMQALRKIFVINGSPCLAAELMLALAERTGEVEDKRIDDDGIACTVTIKRRGRKSPVTASFSMKDAEGMGLAKKDNWIKQPAVMRRWRALAAVLRLTFADAIGGMYLVEELAPDVPVDTTGTPTVSPTSRPVDADLMPRRIGEPPPGPGDEAEAVVIPPEPPPATSDEADVTPSPPSEGDSVPSDPSSAPPPPPIPDGTEPPQAPPTILTIQGRPFETRGATKAQLLAIWEAAKQLKAKGAGADLAKAILRKEFGLGSTHELDAETAERYLLRLHRLLSE